MKDRILVIAGATLLSVTLTGPAMAAIANVGQLPEPASMTLFGLGVAGAFVAKHFIRRK